MNTDVFLMPNRCYRCPGCSKPVWIYMNVDEHDDALWPKAGEVWCGDCTPKAQEWGERRYEKASEKAQIILGENAVIRL